MMRLTLGFVGLMLIASVSLAGADAELPDLALQLVSMNSADDGTKYVGMHVWNIGLVASPPTAVRACTMDIVSQALFNRNPALGQGWCGVGEIPTLGANEFLRMTFPMPVHPCGEQPAEHCYPAGAVPGRHEICGLIDPEAEVREQQKDNNARCVHYWTTNAGGIVAYVEGVLP